VLILPFYGLAVGTASFLQGKFTPQLRMPIFTTGVCKNISNHGVLLENILRIGKMSIISVSSTTLFLKIYLVTKVFTSLLVAILPTDP
jgi:hypothetical protein